MTAEQKALLRARHQRYEELRMAPGAEVPASTKVVAHAVLGRVGLNKDCWPAQDQVCRDTGLSKDVVMRALWQLTNGGRGDKPGLNFFQINPGGSHKSARYTPNDKWTPPVHWKVHPQN